MQQDFARNIEDLNVTETLRQCVSCAVIIVAKNKVSLLTPEAADLLGIPSEKILGKKIEALPEALRSIIEKAFSTGQPVVDQIHLQHLSRGEMSLQVKASPVLNGDEKIATVATVLTDLSCAQQLGEKISRIDKLASIGTLSASMAHEIKMRSSRSAPSQIYY